MATFDEIKAVIGTPTQSLAVVWLIAADKLEVSAEPDPGEETARRAYLIGHAAGYDLVCEGGRVSSAHIFLEPEDGFESFAGGLPEDLPRTATREEVRRRFGGPERSGEAFSSRLLGRQGAWDRFPFGTLLIHFQYGEPDDRIRRITLMTIEDAP